MSKNRFLSLQNLDHNRGFDYVWLWERIGGEANNRLSEIDISFNISNTKFTEFINENHKKFHVIYESKTIYTENDLLKGTTHIISKLNNIDQIFLYYIEHENDILSFAIYYELSSKSIVNDLLDDLLKCKKDSEDEEGIFYTLRNDGMEITTVPMKIDFYPKNLELNYGKEILTFDNKIAEFIESKKSGLVILSGEPGTGKTSYLRHVIQKYSGDSMILYIQNTDFEYILRPEFTSFLTMQKNSILIVEEADALMLPKDEGNLASGIGNLLNLTDGLLGDAYKLKIFVTFNNFSKKKVENALLRPGRLVAEYKFKPLSIENAKKLAEAEGLELPTSDKDKLTLAEIYNKEPLMNTDTKEKVIGF